MIHFDKKQISESATHYYEEEIEVRFQDVDAAGVVFFARFFDYIHQSYEGLLKQLGLPLAQVLEEGTWAAPLRHVEADYFSALRFGDLLRVALVQAHLEESEITLGWRISKKTAKGELKTAAVAQTVHTFIDPKRRERAPVPEEFVQALGSPRLSAHSLEQEP